MTFKKLVFDEYEIAEIENMCLETLEKEKDSNTKDRIKQILREVKRSEIK